MTLSPKASGKLVAELATHVKIKEEGISKLGNVLIEEINSGRLSMENFSQNEFHPKPEDPWALDWLFVVDTLNFCFWHRENREGWMVDGKTGYFALCNAINRALKLIEEINSGRLSMENFSQNEFHPKPEDPWALDWLFVVDTLNFCFWHRENREGWMVDGKTGYFALCNAINRALKEKVDILNPRFYSTVTAEQLSNILRSDTKTKVPLFEERLKSLHEVGMCLLEKFDGSFENCVKQANNSAVELLKIITDNFKCFRDETTYKDNKISLYKRAQILVGDIWSCFKNRGIGYFKDIDEITMFADYRIPQSLLHYKVFEYSQELMEVLKAESVLDYGSEMEVEIRGCSIHAVTLLNDYIKEKVDEKKIANAILIDHFLWDFRRQHAKQIIEKKLPFHKTFCIYY